MGRATPVRLPHCCYKIRNFGQVFLHLGGHQEFDPATGPSVRDRRPLCHGTLFCGHEEEVPRCCGQGHEDANCPAEDRWPAEGFPYKPPAEQGTQEGGHQLCPLLEEGQPSHCQPVWCSC